MTDPDYEESASLPEADSKESHSTEGLLPIAEHIEEVSENGRKVRHKGVYLLPNLFTTSALFSGFYAIVASMSGNFESAAIALFVAMVFDGLDGRVARLTNTQSAFGVQYDSLSDMLSFGVAPALVSFNWTLSSLGKVGWSAAFIYTTCAALRLARFNTQVEVADSRYFTGLASPAAAALLASAVWLGYDGITFFESSVLFSVLAVMAGVLMVTNVKYYSFKGIDLKGRVPFVMMILIIVVFAIVLIHPPSVLFTMAFVYALSGPVYTIWLKRRSNNVGQKP